ncbi:DUF1367 family protein [Yersinia bercovieri]|uniref:DUF1367 family protein n=1 Tax=Yersinia bercovieri TaxID=634 RepID=UPI0021BDAD5D|nr:DUF1367 family protein [Yersinia bercovieri]
MEINNCNNFINDNRPVIDDKCDHSSCIIDAWGMAARARCRAPYTPPVKPKKVVIPTSAATKSEKSKAAKKSNTSSALRLKASELVAVMLGKTLTYTGILAALDKSYPDHGITLRMLQMRMANYAGHSETLEEIAAHYLETVAEQRADRVTLLKSFDAFRRWTTIQAGYFSIIQMPDGSQFKEPKSISFASMDDTEFSELYKATLNVLWNFILNKTFSTPAAAENAASQLLSYA